MKKYTTPIIILLLLGGYFLGRHFYFQPDYDKGELAPDFQGTQPDGGTFHLSDLRGNYVLLEFWGSWCGDCRVSHPKLVELYHRFHGKAFSDAEGFEVVSVGLETHEARWKRAIAQDGLVWKYHTAQFAQRSSQMFDQPLALEYGIRWAPTSFLISPDGHILGVNWSKDKLEGFLSEKLE